VCVCVCVCARVRVCACTNGHEHSVWASPSFAYFCLQRCRLPLGSPLLDAGLRLFSNFWVLRMGAALSEGTTLGCAGFTPPCKARAQCRAGCVGRWGLGTGEWDWGGTGPLQACLLHPCIPRYA